MSQPEKSQSIVTKIFSRKLIAFLAATVALWLGVVDQKTWEAVAIAYLGAQGLVDLAGTGIAALAKKGEGKAWAKSEEKSEEEAPAEEEEEA